MTLAAIGQICSTASMRHNAEQCVTLIKKAAEAGAKAIFFPEASDYIPRSPTESLALAKPISESPFVQLIQQAAAQHQIDINVGIHVPKLSATEVAQSSGSLTQKLYNRSIWIRGVSSTATDGDGESESGGGGDGGKGLVDESASYDKIHLFDYGALQESRHTAPGTSLTLPFPTPVGRVGSLICFDLRFPEAALMLANPTLAPVHTFKPGGSSGNSSGGGGECSESRKGSKHQPAEIITYPSAFTVPTGLAHWELLLRARAIEAQCYIIAAAQVGYHHHTSDGSAGGRDDSGAGGGGPSGRVSYGHSMVIDPWGKVVCHLPGIAADGKTVEDGAVGALGLVDVDLEVVRGIRERMPLVRRLWEM